MLLDFYSSEALKCFRIEKKTALSCLNCRSVSRTGRDWCLCRWHCDSEQFSHQSGSWQCHLPAAVTAPLLSLGKRRLGSPQASAARPARSQAPALGPPHSCSELRPGLFAERSRCARSPCGRRSRHVPFEPKDNLPSSAGAARTLGLLPGLEQPHCSTSQRDHE